MYKLKIEGYLVEVDESGSLRRRVQTKDAFRQTSHLTAVPLVLSTHKAGEMAVVNRDQEEAHIQLVEVVWPGDSHAKVGRDDIMDGRVVSYNTDTHERPPIIN